MPTSHPRCRQLKNERKTSKEKPKYKPLTMAQGGGKSSYFVPKGVGKINKLN
jgi:hypothetical protein